jgi:hypothetical protein
MAEILIILSVFIVVAFAGDTNNMEQFIGRLVLGAVISAVVAGAIIQNRGYVDTKIYTVRGVEYAKINNAVYVRNNSLEIELVGVVIKEK